MQLVNQSGEQNGGRNVRLGAGRPGNVAPLQAWDHVARERRHLGHLG